ncbi:UbiA family prenyltransferase [Paractinoplanes rhizophilus]|uniref:UbiA family prenyltransferase n=1 Tax=Paractinoplanes rhizophilus TaxID=1416877 RepID=A0ABW2HLN6_9ACTN
MSGKLFAHLETWRPYTAFYVGLVGLAGASLTAPHAPAGRLAAAWAIPTLGWLAGLYGGDYFDRHLDAQAKPHRPIPSGRLGAGTALAMFLGCTVAGAVLSLLLNWRTVLLVLVALGTGVAYSKLLKGRGLAGNLARGSMTAFAFWYGSMMVASFPPPRVAVLAVVFVLHDTASNLVGAIRDIDGDRAGGYRTFAVHRGAATATRVAAGLLLAAYAVAVLVPELLNRTVTTAFVAMLASAAAFAAAALARMSGEPSRPAAYRAHTVLVFARILLAGALLGLAPWAPLAVLIVVAALTATGISQRLLRERHEFAPPAETPAAHAVVEFVDRQLATLAAMPGLHDWRRVIDIRLTDPDLRVRLLADDGRISRLAPDDAAPAHPELRITTSGRVFGDIFLHGRSNPRRAYLTRQLTMSASAADMIRLNQLFNTFRTASGAGPATTQPRRPEPVAPPEPPGVVVLSDTTLRDGEQMPGVVFTPAEKRELADRLAAAGIPLIEAGFPAVSADEAAAIRSIVDAGGDALIQAIARPVDRDVDAAVESGAHSIAIFIGTSDVHLRAKLRMTVDEVLRAVGTAVRRAKRAGRQVVFAAEDATRSDLDVLLRICSAAADAGADTIGLADTVGVANPASMADLVRTVTGQCPLPVAVHCHNDLGLATANSLAAIQAGASGVQCSVLGVGERAGNAPLEQVALALHVSLGHDTGLDLGLIQPLADHVAHLIGVPVPPYQPVVGGNAFTHESGLHLDGIVHDPGTYEPYEPGLLGRERHIVLGKHSGVSSVLAAAEAAGLELDHDQARAVLTEIKRSAQAKELREPMDAVSTIARFAPLVRSSQS